MAAMRISLSAGNVRSWPRLCENANHAPCRFGNARFEARNSGEIRPTCPKMTALFTAGEFSHSLGRQRASRHSRFATAIRVSLNNPRNSGTLASDVAARVDGGQEPRDSGVGRVV